MPKVKVEIMRTRTVTYDDQGIVELDVPQSVIDEDKIFEWVEEKYASYDSRTKHEELIRTIDKSLDPQSEDEDITWDHVEILNVVLD